MTKDDKAARQARAKSLRAEIARLKESGVETSPPPGNETPRDFVERRARELEERAKDRDPADEGPGG